MGLARTNGRHSTRGERLGKLAAELEPARAPWWVCEPAGRTPAQGWWWIADGDEIPAFLGHNSIVAETALRQLIEAHYKA